MCSNLANTQYVYEIIIFTGKNVKFKHNRRKTLIKIVEISV